MHEYIPVALIIASVLSGILFNRRDTNELKADMNTKFADMKADTNRQFSEVNTKLADLKADMNRQFTEVNRRLDIVDSDLKQFHTITGKLEGRVDELSRR